MRKILITGGTGYIGSHTAVELLKKNYQVIIIDDLSNSKIKVLEGIEKITGKRAIFYQKDLKNKEEIEKVIKKEKPFSIIHFAAYKAVGESVAEPLKYYKNNLLSLVNLLELTIAYNIKNFVFSSSATVYGEAREFPITEKAEIKKPSNPYGNTKKIAEEILKDLSLVNKDFNVISLRYFNPIGAHKSALIGEYPSGIPANLVPYLTQTAIGKREELKVFGDDYKTPDGTCIRDYIYIVDLAKAHIKALERLENKENKNRFETFNLGTGTGNSVLELIKKFEKITGVKINYKIVNRREGDIAVCYADPSLANKELKWKAETNIEEALLSAWEWERKLKIKN
jgi:UDP-glucose 4-epimerase